MVQTPQQRRANQRYERAESAKRGKPAAAVKKRSDRERTKSPISRIAIIILIFAVCGGAIFELLKLFYR